MPRERETKNHLGKEDLLFHFKVTGIDIRYRSFILHAWQHDKYLNIPVMWLRGPRFLVVWNIHISCNLSFATRGMVKGGIVMCRTITRGTDHAHDSHEWNTCRHKRAINIHYSSAINLQKRVEFSPQL